ncbi:MAG: hypothetical protein HYV95_03145 [Opitutae bacterium]|nr:hypothetical protein [Opitutae bacterium]
MSSKLIGRILGVASGLAAMFLLVAACHHLGWAKTSTSQNYHYTETISNCLSVGAVLAYVLVAAALGYLLRTPPFIALGMMLPWPLAAAVEIAHDKTNHNLLPFEVIMVWAPAFFVAWGPARYAQKLRARIEQPAAPPVIT